MRTVIIEDEERSRKVLESLLERYCPELEIVGLADSVVSGIRTLKDKKPDLIFLDVRLYDGTGFDILESIGDLDASLIFTTAYDQYALKAFKFSAIDYLLKPIDIEELKQAVKKVLKANNRIYEQTKIRHLLSNMKLGPDETPMILISTMESVEFIHINDIIRCHAQGAYCNIHLRDGSVLMASKVIKEFEFLLKDYGFYRIHQSHLVNIEDVKKYLKRENSLLMRDGTKVQLARSRKESFFDFMERIKT